MWHAGDREIHGDKHQKDCPKDRAPDSEAQRHLWFRGSESLESFNELNTELQQNVNQDSWFKMLAQDPFNSFRIPVGKRTTKREASRKATPKHPENVWMKSRKRLDSETNDRNPHRNSRTISSRFLYWFFSLNLVEMVTSTSKWTLLGQSEIQRAADY